jgi:hypothetical protein
VLEESRSQYGHAGMQDRAPQEKSRGPQGKRAVIPPGIAKSGGSEAAWRAAQALAIGMCRGGRRQRSGLVNPNEKRGRGRAASSSFLTAGVRGHTMHAAYGARGTALQML